MNIRKPIWNTTSTISHLLLSEEGNIAVEDSISQNLKEKLQASIPLGNAVALHQRPFANKIEV